MLNLCKVGISTEVRKGRVAHFLNEEKGKFMQKLIIIDQNKEIQLMGENNSITAIILKLVMQAYEDGESRYAESELARKYDLGCYMAEKYLNEGDKLTSADYLPFIEELEKKVDEYIQEK